MKLRAYAANAIGNISIVEVSNNKKPPATPNLDRPMKRDISFSTGCPRNKTKSPPVIEIRYKMANVFLKPSLL